MQPHDSGAEPPQEGELDQLVLRCLSRAEIEGDQALEAACAEHPELAERLRRRMRLLREAGLVASHSSDTDFPEQLGDFRLLRRLGGGGMGVVYAAEQTSLSRRVALKLIRPEHLYFPGARARFAREAQAIARLAHPGIVPVHTVGEAGGIPYLAMELVDGASLAGVLASLSSRDPAELRGSDLLATLCTLSSDDARPAKADTPPFAGSWLEACVWIAREVAQALEHAHQRGVVHRDVKPSNVMLTPSGRVMLVDFGLASTSGGDQVTRTGSAMGSLPYMAPEQIEGRADEVGPLTDVYGLGVALYESLALRRPFDDADGTRLRGEILAARPPRLRKLVPSVPRELDAVVGVAMAPEIAHRYGSAADLARDLTHVLAREPIEARRSSAWLRARRWAQRNPARALAATLAALVVVGGPLGFGFVQRRAAAQERDFNRELGAAKQQVDRTNQDLLAANAELERKQSDLVAALGRESQERERAQANFDYALEAVDTLLARVGDETLAGLPRMDAVRRELLEDALRFYGHFLEQSGDDPEVRMRGAQTRRKVARLRRDLGRIGEASETIADALETLRELERDGFEHPGLDSALCVALQDQASLLQWQGESARAEALHRELIERIERTLAAGTTRPGYYRQLLCDTEQQFAQLLSDSKRPDEAAQHALRAVEELRVLAGDAPDDAALQRRLGGAMHTWAEFSIPLSSTAETESRLAAAIEVLRAAHARKPDDAPTREQLAITLGTLGRFLSAAELDRGYEPIGASVEEALRESIAVAAQLAEEFPLHTRYPGYVAGSSCNLCVHLARTARFDEARSVGERAVSAYEALIALEPEVPRRHSDLGATLCNVGRLQAIGGDHHAALRLFERSIEEQSRAIQGEPENAVFANHMLNHRRALLEAYLPLRRWHDAAEVARGFVELPGAENRLWAAETLVDCAIGVADDEALPGEQRASRSASYRTEALALLRSLVDDGYDRAALAKRKKLTQLADDADFRALLESQRPPE